MNETRTTCPYCGVGCGVIVQSRGDQIVGVRGDPAHPANFGKLCTKGSTLHLTATREITLHQRLLSPMVREARGAAPRAVSWDAALDQVAGGFARVIAAHGPDAVGFYISGQLLTEDYYVFNKLAKGLVGTNNIDTNSRLCMSSAVAGYKKTLGADAPPACYDDVNHAECLFITGSNTAFAHPVLFRRIEEARAARPEMKIVVVDPRRTDTAEAADLHLAIQPGTDVLLCHGLLHVMLWEGWTDADFIARHTNGFDALKTLVRDCTPERVAQVCGIAQQDLCTAARWFATSRATLSLYCQGLNQSTSGTAKNAALVNLHLATGQIGRAGAGPFSLTGQPNAMGGREVGGMANLLSAHRDLSNAAHRAEVAALWGVERVPETPGKTAVEMFEAAADGEIKALWIACTNPAQSLPDQATVRRALERCELVVVQEAFASAATCDFADVLLPATTWGEKDGTVTNSERRISRVRRVVAPAGEARDDWRIAVDVGRRLGDRLGNALGDAREGAREAERLLPYTCAEDVWREHRESTRGRDLDITGLSWDQLERDGPQQWPLPEGAAGGKARLYEDFVFPTPDGRARFAATPYQPPAEARDARYPFALTTGRLRDQWHGMTRTGTLGRLFGHAPEPVVQLHPQDLARRRLAEGDLLRVESRHGAIVLPAEASTGVGTGQAFIAMHWGGEFLSGRSPTGERLAGVNSLTSPAFCPDSKQPELKHTPVKLTRVELPWRVLGLAWLPAAELPARRAALQAAMVEFPFASCVPFGGDAAPGDSAQRVGLLFRAAAAEPVAGEVVDSIRRALGLDAPDTLRYDDARQRQHRAARLVRSGDEVTLDAFLLAGDTRAQAWLQSVLQDALPAQAYGRLVLAPGLTPPVPVPARGKSVCTCFGVAEGAIVAQLSQCAGSADERLAALQSALRCGTNCGSCVPELKRLVRQTPAHAQATEAPQPSFAI